MGFGFDDIIGGVSTGGLYNVGKWATGGYGGKNYLGGVWDAVKDPFERERIDPYQPDPNAFAYGSSYYGATKPVIPDPNTDPNGYIQWMINGGESNPEYQRQMAEWQRQQQALAERERLTGKEAAADAKANTWDGAAQLSYMQQFGSRDQQGDVYNELMGLAKQGPGESSAQAQLRAGSDSAMQSSLALARSGRGAGGGASALRQAQFANAQMQQQTNQQAAILRAQEQEAWRNYQAGLYSTAGGLATNQRQQDLSASQTGLGAANNYNQLSQNYEQMVQQQNAQQLAANIEGERIKGDNVMAAQGANQKADADEDSFYRGMMEKGFEYGGMMALSDVRLKNDVTPAPAPKLQRGVYNGAVQAAGTVGPMFSERASELERAGKPMQRSEVDLYNALDSATERYYGAKLEPEESARRALAQRPADGRSPYSFFQPEGEPARASNVPAPGYSAPDMRPAQGYTYKYNGKAKASGAPAGQQYGPMAQDLEHIPGVVQTDPRTGYETVDTSRLSLANTAALSDTQRRLDELEALVMGGR